MKNKIMKYTLHRLLHLSRYPLFLFGGIFLFILSTIPLIVRAQVTQTKFKRPNVIYILLDDVGFSDIHPYGSEISTPNIDRLAKEGIRYNHFATKAVCSPTRASLMTGRNNQSVGMMDLAFHNGIYGKGGHSYNQGYITPTAATIAQILRANGYRTSMVGKWHLTPRNQLLVPQLSDTNKNTSNWPTSKGFKNFYGWLGGWTFQFQPKGLGKYIIEGTHKVPTPHPQGYNVEDAITTHAIDFLRKGFKNYPNKPEFLYFSLGVAHTPYQVPQRYINKFIGVYEQGWDKLRKKRFDRQKKIGIIPINAVLTKRNPGDLPWDSLTNVQKTVYARFMATYAGYISEADHEIGRLIDFLKDVDQYKNTLVFFMSDNGAAPEAGESGNFYHSYFDTTSVNNWLYHLNELGTEKTSPLYQRPWAMLSDTPFKRYKLWPNLGGVRDPLIVSWPNKILDHGAVRTQYVDVIDITPTVLDILNITPPKMYDGVKQMPIQGKSIRKTFTNPKAKTRNVQFFDFRGSRAIRKGGWRAVAIHKKGTSFSKGQWQLYYLANDFSGAIDLSKKYPEKLKELKKLWWKQAKKYGALPLVEWKRKPAVLKKFYHKTQNKKQ
jgi:arylsulfatase